jgi:hypothetical protein
MAIMVKLPMLAAAVLLAGCATLSGPPALPGDSMDAVRAKMGRPTAVRTAPSGTVYEYGAGMFGQQAWMARFDSSGRLLSVTQVRTGEVFATIRPGVATKADVLDRLGQPSETSRVHLGNFEVWSYRYKESNVWNSMMHVHFDQGGVVRLMQSGPDPFYEDKRPY